jgi:SUMO ligase MMS21 Smc5/6 complex component
LGGAANRHIVDDDDEDGEDGLTVFDVQISTMDPFTMKEMIEPVKSNKCGHAYEKSSILGVLKNKNTTM